MLQVKAGSQLSSARVKVCEGASSGENMVHLYTEAQRVYGKLHAFEFEYATQCNKAAYHVNDDVDLMAVIEFSM
jgi:hypothetical protein